VLWRPVPTADRRASHGHSLYDDDPLERERPALRRLRDHCSHVLVFLVQRGGERGYSSHDAAELCVVFPPPWPVTSLPAQRCPPVMTFLTYMFLHGSWLPHHFNCCFLWVFGDNIEDALGRLRFIAFYLLCGIIGGLAYTLHDPSATRPADRGVRRSCRCGWRLPCAATMRSVEVLVLGLIPMKLDAFWVIGFWALTQVWHVLVSDQPGVAWWAHVGGLTAARSSWW